jgi:hypothetical protein
MRSTASCLIARYKVERCTPNFAAIAFMVYLPRSISSQANATCADVRTRRECPFMLSRTSFHFILRRRRVAWEKHDILVASTIG